MAIEFHCPHCDKLLKTGDDKAGVSAKCPGCSEIVTVPAASPARAEAEVFAPRAVKSSPPPADESAEFKHCPMCGEQIRMNAVKCRYCGEQVNDAEPTGDRFEPTVVEMSSIFEKAWELYKANLGLCIGVNFLWALLCGMTAVPMVIVASLADAGGVDNDLAPILILPLILLSYALLLFLGLGMIKFTLKLARGQQAQLQDLFSGGGLFLTAVGAAVLFGLMYIPGILLCVIPGIFVVLMFWPFLHVIVDRHAGVTESLSLARSITTGNLLTGFLMFLINVALQFAGTIACYVGLLFTMPLIMLIYAVAYLMMSGQIRARR